MYYYFHTKPFKHQKKALKLSLKRGSLGYLMEPGSGKTKPAVDFIGCRYLRDGHKKVLVFAPKSVIGVWEDQIREHLHPDIERRVIRLEGGGSQRKALIQKHKNPDILTVFIISYDSAWRSKEDLQRWKPDGVIADESHYIKGATSRRSRGAIAIRKSAKWGLILTGTFLSKSPLDAYAQLNFVNPEIFPMSWTKFKDRYSVWVRMPGGWQKLKRYKRLHELKRIIRENCIIVYKEDVLDLPEQVDQIVPVDMPAKAWKYYNQMKEEKLVELKQGDSVAKVVVTELLRFQQITSGFLTVDTGEFDHRDRPIREEVDVHSEKIQALRELVQIHKAHGEKIAVFCRFRWEVDKVCKALKQDKVSYAVIDGRVKNRDRDKIRADFQKGLYDVMVLNIGAGGIGITLTAASVGIFLSLTFRYDLYKQARERLHRPGQTRRVKYYHLIVRGSIDEKLMHSIEQKKSLADEITPSNWADFI